MKVINIMDLNSVSGGEIVPGYPSPETLCTNVKLMVLGSHDQPGFDVSAAVWALMHVCPDFWDPNMAHEYAMSGGVPMPA